jgi:hypothetical protein
MSILPIVKQVSERILIVRAEKVILDADLVAFYGVSTKRLNEQVHRNRGRSPEDFLFRLTPEEKAEVVAKCDHLRKLKYSKTLTTRIYRARSTDGGERSEQFTCD